MLRNASFTTVIEIGRPRHGAEVLDQEFSRARRQLARQGPCIRKELE